MALSNCFFHPLNFTCMTKSATFFALVCCLFFSGGLIAQQSIGGTPVSFLFPAIDAVDVPVVVMPAVDVDELMREDQAYFEATQEKRLRFGAELPVALNLNNAGRVDLLPAGDRLWRVAVESSGARSLNFIFSRFRLPAGAQLFLYSADRRNLLGAFTEANNQDDGKLGTTLLPGDRVIVEYYEPLQAAFRGEVEIGTVVHGYRDLGLETSGTPNERGFGASGSCNINVNCPLGDGWGAQKRSAVRIVNGGDWCSGAMINNTSNNGTPYLLTANHCYASSISTWVFWFNWQAPTCSNPGSSPAYNSLSGSTLKARRSDVDFCLLQLNSTPPTAWDVFYAGWNRGTAAATQTTGIHHPSGDIKKISRDNNAATNGLNSGWGSDHWRVYWDQAVTEGGSSGSPLFDQNKRIVGQLHGGASACGQSASNLWDEYGKFSLSWDGASASKRLRSWLDPTNTGATTNNGYSPTGNYALAVGSNGNVGSNAAQYSYDIVANVGWQASSLVPWLRVESVYTQADDYGGSSAGGCGNNASASEVSDRHNGVLRIRFEANADLRPRTGVIRLSGPGTESTLTLTQFGAGSRNDIFAAPQLALSPNPTTGRVQLTLRAELPATIEVFDLAGRRILQTEAAGSAQLDLSGEAPGVYIVRVSAAGQVWIERLVKQ